MAKGETVVRIEIHGARPGMGSDVDRFTFDEQRARTDDDYLQRIAADGAEILATLIRRFIGKG